MSDIANLGIKVTQEGITQADASLAKLEKTSRRTELQADKLEQKLIPLNEQFTRVGHNSNVAGNSLYKFGQHADRNAAGLRTMRMAALQSGYQIQDFAVQVQGGTDAMVALGQQGSQFLSIFGPGGAIAGAALAVGAAIYTGIAGSIPQTEEKLEDLIKKIDDLTDAERDALKIRLQNRISDLADQSGNAAAKVSVMKDEIRRTNSTIEDLSSGSSYLKGILDQLFTEDKIQDVKNMEKEVTTLEGSIATNNAEIQKWRTALEQAGQQGLLTATLAAKEAKESFSDLSETYATQINLLGKTEEQQAKLAAQYQLGSGATKEQIQAVDALVEKYFELKQAEAAADSIEKLEDQVKAARIETEKGGKAHGQFIAEMKLGESATEDQKNKARELAGTLYELKEAQRQSTKEARDSATEARRAERALDAWDKRLSTFKTSLLQTPVEKNVAQYQIQLDALKELGLSEEDFQARSIQLWEAYYQKHRQLSAQRAQAIKQTEDQIVQNNLTAVQTATTSLLQYLDEGSAAGKAAFIANQALSAAIVFNQGQAASAAALAAPPIGLGPVAGAGLAASIEAKTVASMGAIMAQTVAGVARVQGGQTPAGRVLVGERGPEIVNLDRPSYITPTSDMGGEGGGLVVKQYFNITGSGDAALANATKKAAEDGARMAYQAVYQDFKNNGDIRKVSKL